MKERTMQNRTKIAVTVREKNTAGMFQVDVTPTATLSGKALAQRWAAYSHTDTARAQATLIMLEGFILSELAEGRKLDFGLVSFYPRLSGALPSRDSSPDAEGLYVRGAVKARRSLMTELKDKLEAVNSLSTVHSRVFNIFDKTVSRFDVVAAGHVLSVSGVDIPVDATKEDEGFWLEKRTHSGSYVRVTKGRVVGATCDLTEVVFDEPIVRGAYVLAVYTRCGHGADYHVVRVSRKIRAL
jgi:hypothetical protein